ncbi:hypothetical protein ACP3P6_14940 [Enterobacter mori]
MRQRDLEDVVKNQNASVSVFLGEGVVELLASLKRLASVLNALPVIRRVTLYGDIPDGWLYGTLRSLLNNSQQLSLIRISSVADLASSLTIRDEKQGTLALIAQSIYGIRQPGENKRVNKKRD